MKHLYTACALYGLMASPAMGSLPEFNATMTEPASKTSVKSVIKKASSLVAASHKESDPKKKAALLAQSADLYAQVAKDPDFVGDNTSIIVSAAHIYVRAARAAPDLHIKQEYYTKSQPFWRELSSHHELSEIDAPFAEEAFEATGDHEEALRMKNAHLGVK